MQRQRRLVFAARRQAGERLGREIAKWSVDGRVGGGHGDEIADGESQGDKQAGASFTHLEPRDLEEQ